jgi:hypothetical protein
MDGNREVQPLWLDSSFWHRLSELERSHEQLQNEHEAARRQLDRVRRDEVAELQRLWVVYRDIIEQLERTSAALESLRLAPLELEQAARAAEPKPPPTTLTAAST